MAASKVVVKNLVELIAPTIWKAPIPLPININTRNNISKEERVKKFLRGIFAENFKKAIPIKIVITTPDNIPAKTNGRALYSKRRIFTKSIVSKTSRKTIRNEIEANPKRLPPLRVVDTFLLISAIHFFI